MDFLHGAPAILVSLLLLIWLAYCNVTVLVLAPICALLAVLLDGQHPLLASYTQVFMASVAAFIRDFFPLFLLGAIFGKLMEDSGAAARISAIIARAVGPRHTILALVLSCALLTYGGVSLFVVVFTVYPLARAMFQSANIPARLIPATIALGSFTFTMTALPGTVQIQNQIPMQFFRTNSFAAPGLGIIGGLAMFLLGILWLTRRAASAKSRGEGFSPTPHPQQNSPQNDISLVTSIPAWKCFAPLLLAVSLNFVLSLHVIPRWSADYLKTDAFGKTDLSKLVGSWATILALTAAILLVILLHFRSLAALKNSLAEGARAALLPIFNTASEVGYGNTIKTLAGFQAVQKFVTSIAPQNPLISEAIAVNALAAVTGSASGGLSIALNTLGETYYQRALALGIDPQLLHRIASMSCGGLDSLPHNGAVVTLLLICGITHRQGYKDIAIVTVLSPLLATALVLFLGTLFGSF